MNSIVVTLLLFAIFECKGITRDADSINSTKMTEVEKINESISGRQTGYGLIKFEGQAEHDDNQNNLVTFAEDSHNNRPLKFENGPSYTVQNQVNAIGEELQSNIVFQHDNRQNISQNTGQKKRRKRRRKPRKLLQPQTLGNGFLPPPGGIRSPSPLQSYGQIPPGPLSTLSDAFNSIVRNDDKYCVSRMLCEQAATGVINANSNIAKTILTILQYMPLLQSMVSYDAFPLFGSVATLGIAINIGQTSKNETVCRYRYPECPTDPEERLQYFNSHRGGFSHFFRGETQHYTAQEFHNNLLNMGLEPHAYGYQGLNPISGQYGVFQPSLQGGNGIQQPYAYGLTQPNLQPFRTNNGLLYPNAGYVKPNQKVPYNYGPAYPYYRRFNSNRDQFRNIAEDTRNENSINEIQKRIQNKPEVFADKNVDDEAMSYKWSFPKLESAAIKLYSSLEKVRNGRQLKFPDTMDQMQHTDTKMQVVQGVVKQAKGFSFPGAQSNRQYLQIFSDDNNDFPGDDSTFDSTGYESTGDFKNADDGDDEGVETVYVVRGNGDPKRPEIVKLRPGEKIH